MAWNPFETMASQATGAVKNVPFLGDVGATTAFSASGLADKLQTGADKVFGGEAASKAGLGRYKAEPITFDESPFLQNKAEIDQIMELRRQLAQTEGRQAQQVQAPTLANALAMQAAQVGNAQTAQAAQLNQAQQNQVRGQQMGLVEALQQQAAGQGPSLAQNQLNQARDQQIQTAMALAASQRGLTAGQGLRSIADQTAQAQQFAASEAARARIAEQLAAREQLAGVLQGTRAADIGVASQQAGLEQQANLANQAAQNQFALQQAAFGQEAAARNQAAQNQFALQQAGMTQQAALANQQAGLQQQGLNQSFINALNQQIGALDIGQQQKAADLERLKIDMALKQQGLEAGAYGDWQNRTTGFISGLAQAGATMAGGA